VIDCLEIVSGQLVQVQLSKKYFLQAIHYVVKKSCALFTQIALKYVMFRIITFWTHMMPLFVSTNSVVIETLHDATKQVIMRHPPVRKIALLHDGHALSPIRSFSLLHEFQPVYCT